ncbi:MAG: lasso peptide biosynthesis B2 protein [Desulforhopalus sp.]|nr:lasso peptide biosynthesis B2 protein [Desulforhopalus sp.]
MESFLMLGIARLAVLLLRFKWLTLLLGEKKTKIDEYKDSAKSSISLARSIGKTVGSAANYTPWESLCLPQAVAALWMMKRRGIACTLCLGVAKHKSDPDKLTAHAWLCCDGVILTGAENYEKYTVVAMFS